ncbi:MAG: hypothetical protein ACYC2P_03500 [Paludibacteraceae bacterium]
MSAQQKNADISLVFSVKKANDWVFYSPQSPRIDLTVKRTTSHTLYDKIGLAVTSDKHVTAYIFLKKYPYPEKIQPISILSLMFLHPDFTDAH